MRAAQTTYFIMKKIKCLILRFVALLRKRNRILENP
jgi:hypothetical protein